MIAALIVSLAFNGLLAALVVSERLGRERLIRHVEARSPAEVAMLERAVRAPRRAHEGGERLPDFDELRSP